MNVRKIRKDRITRDLIPCACGCGELLESMDKRAHYRKYIGNHWRRKMLKGNNGPAWKGGKYFNRDGYLFTYRPNHPNNTFGYVFEHRLVMEKHLGRYLTKDEIVHHINGNRKDNRIDNLQVMMRADHVRLHKPRLQSH